MIEMLVNKSIFICFIFLGSVFLTSEKFVDTENAAKFYFTTLGVLLGLIIYISKTKNEISKLPKFFILKGFYIIGVLQAAYGILQYINIFPSHHNIFPVTGSFDNPAGFAAILSLLFPVGLYWCTNAKKLEQKLVFFTLGLLVFAVILCGARLGFLAILLSSLIVLFFEFDFLKRVKTSRKLKFIFFAVLLIFVCGTYGLYKINTDSVNGRLLIWQVSSDMIKDKPIIGFGYKGFQANYMSYQASYFKKHPQSKYAQLADNVKHPFNEFIKITVNYGILGLILYLSLLVFVFIKLWYSGSSFRIIQLSTFWVYITLSCFSYPLQYTPVNFLLVFYLLLIFVERFPKQISLYTRGIVAILCALGVVITSLNMYRELQWKTIASKSLQGETIQMLSQYKELHPKLKRNGFFLYNYGAELNIAKNYNESIVILKECEELFNDYDLQILLADNYLGIDSASLALSTLQNAANMIPCRFLPLHKQFEIHKQHNDRNQAIKFARAIKAKEIKVSSGSVRYIVYNAKTYLDTTNE